MTDPRERAREILARQYESGNYVARASTIRDGANVPWLEIEFVLPAMLVFRAEALEEAIEVCREANSSTTLLKELRTLIEPLIDKAPQDEMRIRNASELTKGEYLALMQPAATKDPLDAPVTFRDVLDMDHDIRAGMDPPEVIERAAKAKVQP